MRKLILALVLLAACHSSAPPAPESAVMASTSPVSTATTPTPAATPVEASATPKLGDKCSANDACTAPATCVSYTGIAGPREVKCKADADCPAGTRCRVIADGPGNVCRR
jgi:hypothetical protein